MTQYDADPATNEILQRLDAELSQRSGGVRHTPIYAASPTWLYKIVDEVNRDPLVNENQIEIAAAGEIEGGPPLMLEGVVWNIQLDETSMRSPVVKSAEHSEQLMALLKQSVASARVRVTHGAATLRAPVVPTDPMPDVLSNMADGQERLTMDATYIWRRLLLVFTPRQAEIWLTSHNSMLGGRPVDVLKLSGPAEVVHAIDAAEQGAYS